MTNHMRVQCFRVNALVRVVEIKCLCNLVPVDQTLLYQSFPEVTVHFHIQLLEHFKLHVKQHIRLRIVLQQDT